MNLKWTILYGVASYLLGIMVGFLIYHSFFLSNN